MTQRNDTLTAGASASALEATGGSSVGSSHSTPAPDPATPTLSAPQALLTGKKLPTKPHTFTTADGTKVTVLLQGLTYMEKSEVDALAKQDREEIEQTGILRPSMWGPRLIARAMRNPDGSRSFRKEEDWRLFAIQLAEQSADGEISRASNVVLDLSGFGEEAEEKAGKASRKTGTTSS